MSPELAKKLKDAGFKTIKMKKKTKKTEPMRWVWICPGCGTKCGEVEFDSTVKAKLSSTGKGQFGALK